MSRTNKQMLSNKSTTFNKDRSEIFA